MVTDFIPEHGVGVQISADGTRIWVCVDGECVMRAKDVPLIQITDDRPVEPA
jgi:hypothetical protein